MVCVYDRSPCLKQLRVGGAEASPNYCKAPLGEENSAEAKRAPLRVVVRLNVEAAAGPHADDPEGRDGGALGVLGETGALGAAWS